MGTGQFMQQKATGPQPPPRNLSGYSRLQIALHWIIVGLIGTQLLLNDGMQQSFDDRMHGSIGADGSWAALHMIIGIGIFALAALRLTVRLTRGAPPPPADNPALVTWAGILNHLALYLLMFAMPLTGAIAWFGFSDIAAELHEFGRPILIALIALHVFGALVEHLVLGQNTLLRMFRTEENLPRKATPPPSPR